MMMMEFALSMPSAHLASGARRRYAAAIAAALALASPSIAGADVVTSDFNTLANNANQLQVVCAQKVQRNCVWNWQTHGDDSETPGTSDEGAHHDGLGTLLTDEATDALWPDFTQWADDLMYRRWTRPIGVGNPVFGGGPPVPSEEAPGLIVEGGPRAPSPEVLSLFVVEDDPPPGTRAVPEPSSLSLLLASMAVGMGIVERARRRSTQK
jgi:hypothetical protein